jgi:hypothetical protein
MTVRKRTAVGIACVCLFAGSTRIVNAQAVTNSFHELTGKLKPGQKISIRDDAGRRINGKVTEVSASSIRIMSGGVQQTLTQETMCWKSRRHAGALAGERRSGWRRD